MQSKRVLDVVVSSVALAVLWPLMLAVALMIRAKLGTPILFVQERPGLGGRPFRMFKFRTMRDQPKNGESIPDAQRLVPLGAFLRDLSLDELPELWNVLRGDMSLVGPRPLLMEYLPLYTSTQARRHQVKPGVTGWAQINGRNSLSWEKKFELDLWYIDNQSLGLDLKILLLTLIKVFRKEDVRAPGEATMPRFEGSNERS